MPTVFLALGRLSHYSDVLRGGFLGYLAKTHKVIVLTEAIDDEVAERDHFLTSGNIVYIKCALSYPRVWRNFDHYIRLAFVREFDHLAVTRLHFYKPDHPFKTRFLIKLGAILPKALSRAPLFTAIEKKLVRPREEFMELVRAHEPALLVTATPGLTPFESEMIIFASHLGIPTVAIDLNYDNPSILGKFFRKTDWLGVWNPYMKEETMEFEGYAENQLAVIGPLRFDHYFPTDQGIRSREEFLKSKNLDPERKLILYATPTPIIYPPRKEFMRALMALKSQGLLEGDPNILVRLHPHDISAPYEEYLNTPGICVERAGHVRVPDDATKGQKVEMEEEDLKNLKESLAYADVVINFASTMTIEACIFDKPVINIGFPARRLSHYEYSCNKVLLEAGGARLAKSPDDLKNLVNQYLARPELDRDKRKYILSTYAHFADGRSYRRAGDFVASIINR